VRRLALALLFVAATCLPAGAAPHRSGKDGVSEVLLKAMQDELDRTVKRLRLAGLAAPHFVAFTVLETHGLELRGNFGALERPQTSSTRRVQVEVRTGSAEFDDTHFVSRSARALRPITGRLPIEDDYDALRATMWQLADRAYKEAVERLAQKRVYAESNNIQELLPDLSDDPVHVSRETRAAETVDPAAWEEAVRAISGEFRKYPEILTSEVDLSWRAQHIYFVDSQGRSYVKPGNWFQLRMEADTQAADGMPQSDDREFLWRSLEHVPPTEALAAEAGALAREMTALAAAPKIETYLGPVLLEGQAAGEFFVQLLATGLANPREIWAQQDWVARNYPTGALTGRLGLRVIAPLFDVVDDPTLERFGDEPLIGHYKIDEEGIPAQRVNLVERGILRDLLMSRAPTKERTRSNGHGRGGFSAPAAANISTLLITPSETMPLDEMKRRLREEAGAFGLDHGILIRRIAEDRHRDAEELLSEPILVYEVDVASGEERLVRDAQFSAVTLRALRDVIAASDRQHVYNVAKKGAFRSSPTARSSIVHPSVLLSEMELVETDDKPSKRRYLPHPYFVEPAAD
jgi:predicted Zn-dependent protease